MTYQWTNQATADFAEWLVEDVVGVELARELQREPAIEDTPVINLAAKLRGLITRMLPVPLDPEWLAQINWIEVAAYLVDEIDLES